MMTFSKYNSDFSLILEMKADKLKLFRLVTAPELTDFLDLKSVKFVVSSGFYTQGAPARHHCCLNHLTCLTIARAFQFIGFLEPYMKDGHLRRWRH